MYCHSMDQKITYQKSLVQLMQSILNKFQGTNVDGIPGLETYLNRYSKIALVLIDGMGMMNLNQLSSSHSFLKDHLWDEIDTVFPPTTVAATTTICSGLPPISTGWIGWMQYFKEEDNHAIMFFNKDYYMGNPMKETPYEKLPFEYFWKKLGVPYSIYMPFDAYEQPGYHNLEEMIDALKTNLKKEGPQYHYFYYDRLDSLMHHHGIDHPKVQKEFNRICSQLQYLYQHLDDDTLICVIADHGHINTKIIDLGDYPDIVACLKIAPALETRALTFYVKEECKTTFENLFNQYFKEDFDLYTHQEVFDLHLFGYGKEHERIHEFVGDYLAIATKEKAFCVHPSERPKGNHAGGTKEEMKIPLILLHK